MSLGVLTLIPTPIDETSQLTNEAYSLLLAAVNCEKSIFVVEDLKPGRKRWIHFKLPKEVVERFVLLNEHTANKISKYLLDERWLTSSIFRSRSSTCF
jgi:16S rRNA (cytidine1402-2'-O)-methyltransferase